MKHLLNKQQIAEAREWLAELTFRDEPEIDALTDEQVIAGVARHYSGGVVQFIKDGE